MTKKIDIGAVDPKKTLTPSLADNERAIKSRIEYLVEAPELLSNEEKEELDSYKSRYDDLYNLKPYPNNIRAGLERLSKRKVKLSELSLLIETYFILRDRRNAIGASYFIPKDVDLHNALEKFLTNLGVNLSMINSNTPSDLQKGVQLILPQLIPIEDKDGNEKKTRLSIDKIGDMIVSDFKVQLRHNLVKNEKEVLNAVGEWVPVDESIIVELEMALSKAHTFQGKAVERAIKSRRVAPVYDPLRFYFENLPAWDGIDRFPDLIKTLDIQDTPEDQISFIETAFRKFYKGIYKLCEVSDEKVYENNEIMIVLHGKQGCGKDRFWKASLPKELQEFYTEESLTTNDKRDRNAMLSSYILINLSESEIFKSMTSEKFKGIISSGKLSQRTLYTSLPENLRRRASIVGSTNEAELIRDLTGNRRLVVVNVGKVNFNHEIDMNQIFAQAKEAPGTWYFEDDEIEMVNTYSEDYKVADMAVEAFIEAFEILEEKEWEPKVIWDARLIHECLLEISNLPGVRNERSLSLKISSVVKAYRLKRDNRTRRPYPVKPKDKYQELFEAVAKGASLSERERIKEKNDNNRLPFEGDPF